MQRRFHLIWLILALLAAGCGATPDNPVTPSQGEAAGELVPATTLRLSLYVEEPDSALFERSFNPDVASITTGPQGGVEESVSQALRTIYSLKMTPLTTTTHLLDGETVELTTDAGGHFQRIVRGQGPDADSLTFSIDSQGPVESLRFTSTSLRKALGGHSCYISVETLPFSFGFAQGTGEEEDETEEDVINSCTVAYGLWLTAEAGVIAVELVCLKYPDDMAKCVIPLGLAKAAEKAAYINVRKKCHCNPPEAVGSGPLWDPVVGEWLDPQPRCADFPKKTV